MMGGAWYILPMIIGSLVASLSALVGQVLQFRNTRRTASGSIDTSDARTVWEREEAITKRMEQHYEMRVKWLESENARKDTEIASMKALVSQLTADLALVRSDLAVNYCNKRDCDSRLRSSGGVA